MPDDPTSRAVIERAVRASFERQAGRILVAVSGGVDSLALLVAAAGVAGGRTGVGSVDHGLRPEAAAEVARVRELARSLALPFHTESLSLRPGPGAEARARAARYAALERMAREHGYAAIATAHTADDQAETLLMRLARGSALRFLLTRLVDFLNVPPGALVKPKDPLEYVRKLRFHQAVTATRDYGIDA